MSVDWMDRDRDDRFTFEMIDPFDLSETRGNLENVLSCSITMGYYTDTRVSAQLVAVNHNYVDYSLIRIHHYVDAEGYHKELGTFFVSGRSKSKENATEETFNLTSMLDRVSEDLFTANYVISKGKTSRDILADIFKKYSVSYSIGSGVGSKIYQKATVYEIGSNVLETLHEIADSSTARIDVNGHGTVTVTSYIAPSKKTPIFSFNDHNGTVYGSISKTNTPFEAVNRLIVASDKEVRTTTKDSKGKTVTKTDVRHASGFADVASSSAVSYNKLGRRRTEFETVDELNPFTNAQAQNLAKSKLGNFEQDPAEYMFSGIYYPFNLGDVVTVGIDNKYQNVFVKNMEIDLSPGMICKYTCKAV